MPSFCPMQMLSAIPEWRSSHLMMGTLALAITCTRAPRGVSTGDSPPCAAREGGARLDLVEVPVVAEDLGQLVQRGDRALLHAAAAVSRRSHGA
jgi:hypothetical protein